MFTANYLSLPYMPPYILPSVLSNSVPPPHHCCPVHVPPCVLMDPSIDAPSMLLCAPLHSCALPSLHPPPCAPLPCLPICDSVITPCVPLYASYPSVIMLCTHLYPSTPSSMPLYTPPHAPLCPFHILSAPRPQARIIFYQATTYYESSMFKAKILHIKGNGQ